MKERSTEQIVKDFVLYSALFLFTEKSKNQGENTMQIKQAKVYNDGGHYIAIPPENFPRYRKRHKPKPKPKAQTNNAPTTPKEKFETAYAESQSQPRRERKKYIKEQMQDAFPTEEETMGMSIPQSNHREKMAPKDCTNKTA